MIKTIRAILLGVFFISSVWAGELPGNSIYQIDSKWITQDGKEMELKDLRGKPTILSMVYLSCEYICPTVISEVQSIDEKLGKNKNDVQVVLVSFDPERDTPQVMKSYAKTHELDSNRWTLMSNKNESKIRELAVSTYFNYKKIEKDKKIEFTHSYMILLLDQDGMIKARLDGANLDHKPMIKTIQELTSVKK